MVTKKCCRCGVEKEETFENFIKDTRRKSGLGGVCRECHNARTREIWHSKHTKKEVDEVDYDIKYNNQGEKEIEVKRLPRIPILTDREYTIVILKHGNGIMTEKIVKGKVIQETDRLVVFQTKNYAESFTKWELGKYRINIR